MTFPTMRHRRFTPDGDDAGERISSGAFGAGWDEVAMNMSTKVESAFVQVSISIPRKKVDNRTTVKVQIPSSYGIRMHEFFSIACKE